MDNIEEQTDSAIITNYLNGDTSVLPILVKRYHKIFLEKSFWITKDRCMSKDVAQDCWVTILSKLHTLNNVNSFKNWALRIVYSKSIDVINRRKHEIDKLPSNIFDDSDSNCPNDHGQNIYKALLKAIKQLPKEKQDIIRLFYTEDYSINEISKFLNVPLGTVKSRLFKAREKLKSYLKK